MAGRIYGIETEFGVLPVLGNPKDISDKVLSTGFLRNGGRYYVCVSGNHPEYATPECASIRDLVKYDKAGEIVTQALSPKLELYKNNLDYLGKETFGCHENYLIREKIFNTESLSKIIPFLVTRQIFAGAGWIEFYHEGTMKYDISQRAQKIETEFSSNSTEQRPIIHLRDDPHTTIGKRLHLILGDANMSEVATYLKVGTTSLVLDLLEDGLLDGIVSLENPVKALHVISEDQSRRWLVRTNDEKIISAIDVQRLYLERAKAYKGTDPETDEIIRRWEGILTSLEKRDFSDLSRKLDWALKKRMLEFYLGNDEKATIDKLRSLELIYSSINREEGLYYLLQDQCRVDRIVADSEIEEASKVPPRDTRAWIRGNLVGKRVISSLDWNFINTIYEKVYMDDPFDDQNEKLEEILALHGANKPTSLKRIQNKLKIG